MSVISSALEDEKELEDTKKEKHDKMIERSKRQAMGSDITSLSDGKGYRYETDPVKG